MEHKMSETQDTLVTSRKARYYTILYLLILMIFAIAVSGALYLNQSLRLDEAQSLWQSRGSFSSILKLIAHDVHVPLYHLILHVWLTLFGNGVVAVRVLSLIFFILNIPAIYALGKLAYSRAVGLFSATIVATSPFMVWYGNEARMYSLLTLLTILNSYFFVSIYKKRGTYWSWIGYTITAILGVYTHYFFFLLLVAQVVFFFAKKEIFPRKALSRFLIIAGIVIASFLPWAIYVFKSGSASNMRPLLLPPSSFDIFNTFSYFLFGFHPDFINTIFVSLWPLSALFIFLALRHNVKFSPESQFFALAVLVPMVLAYVISFVLRPVFLPRYLILTLPPLLLVISAIILTYPKRLSAGIQTILVSLMLITLFTQGYSDTTPVKENYRAAVNLLNEEVGPSDLIIVSAPFTIYPVEYYYRGLGKIETLPNWDRSLPGAIPNFNERTLPAQVDQIKEDHGRAFLLLSYDQGYENNVKSYFDSNFERLETHNISPGMHLYVYDINNDQNKKPEVGLSGF